ncbi:MAG: KH domain-containing protein [Elusimicrobia bacterium]|nr:KH domain-containing protein [Elusimicrobiota bacterium]
MKELVVFLAKSLVDKPDAVSVDAVDSDGVLKMQLKVADEDKGKIIGKKGRIIRAIRSLLFVSSTRAGKKSVLEIG